MRFLLVLPAHLFSNSLYMERFPLIGSEAPIVLRATCVCSFIPFYRGLQSWGTQRPLGACPHHQEAQGWGFRLFSENPQTSLYPLPLFFLSTPFSRAGPSQEPKSLSLPLPPSLSYIPEDGSAQLTDHQSTKPKPRAALCFLEFLGPSLGYGLSTGHPPWALNY